MGAGLGLRLSNPFNRIEMIKVIEIVHVPYGVKMLKLGEIISVTRLMYKAKLMQDGISLSGIVDGGVYIFEPA